MRNTSKMTTLENRFPLLAVEHGCIISKDADITVAFEVELPELYTVTGAEYEAIHSCWCKAIKVLPDYSVVHKQDWFIKERYKPELQKDDMSFLSRSFERHFNERPYLKHSWYLYSVSYTHLDVYKRQVAFATQKGGIGKSTVTALAASYLHNCLLYTSRMRCRPRPSFRARADA